MLAQRVSPMVEASHRISYHTRYLNLCVLNRLYAVAHGIAPSILITLPLGERQGQT